MVPREASSVSRQLQADSADREFAGVSVWQHHTKVKTRKGERGWVLQTLLPPPTLPYLSTFRVSLSRHLAVSSLAVIHTGRHPETWLSGITTAVQAAGTSEVVASFADAHTSASVLTKPAVPGDLTTAAEFVLCVFYPCMTVPDRLCSGLSVL